MGSSAARSSDPVVGRLVDGRYRVTGVIARGGMATVYRADDTRLDRVVALKVMHRSFAEDPGFVDRFEREARAAAKLSHPHVVGVFDQGADDGLVWLAMDYVPGFPLREVIGVHAPLDADRALGVVEQILSGLIAAHEAGFVHRDIKPENVLMTPDGTMKITDFGLARAMMDDHPSAATKGVLIGTVAYLAPEQVESGHADERSDIYSTGIVLYELLTGGVPFQGPTALTVAYRHVNDRVPPPSASVAGIPPEVDALVLRATARDPQERFPSALAFLQAAQAVDVAGSAGESAVGEAGAPGQPSVAGEPGATGDGAWDTAGAGGAGDPGATHRLEEPPDDADEWERIAAVATTSLDSTGTDPTGADPIPSLRPGAAPDHVTGADSSTRVISDAPARNPGEHTQTHVLGGQTAQGPNAATTTALGSGGAAFYTGTGIGASGATTVQPGQAPRRGATALTPVTRKPPPGDYNEESRGEGVASISRFGRTKLLVLLALLLSLMAACGWWLGMRHNASEQVGSASVQVGLTQPSDAASRLRLGLGL